MFDSLPPQAPALPPTPQRGPRGGKAASRRVCAIVARDFGIGVDDLLAATRGTRQVALARQAAMYLCHVGFALSFAAIGRAFARDRTTVAHACRLVEDNRDDIWFDCRIAALERACGVAAECEAAPDRAAAAGKGGAR